MFSVILIKSNVLKNSFEFQKLLLSIHLENVRKFDFYNLK